MKRSIILRIYAIASATLFGICFLIYFLCTKEVFPLWFSLGCFFIGGYQILRAYFFKQDGAFWFGSLLILLAVAGVIKFHFSFSEQYILPLYFLCAPLSSLFTAVFYKKHLHYKISFILILEDFLILLYSKSVLSLLWLIFVNLALALMFFGGKYVFNRKRRL